MSSEITTRRALEVCMSRLAMDRSSRDWFARQLAFAIEHGDVPVVDVDTRRATVMRALANLEDVDDSYTKRDVIQRMQGAKALLRQVLDE